MKLAAVSCLLIASIAEASFVIEKTHAEKYRKSKLKGESSDFDEPPTLGQQYGISALNNPSYAYSNTGSSQYNKHYTTSDQKGRASHKSNGQSTTGRSSVNFISGNFGNDARRSRTSRSAGSEPNLNKNARKSLKRGGTSSSTASVSSSGSKSRKSRKDPRPVEISPTRHLHVKNKSSKSRKSQVIKSSFSGPNSITLSFNPQKQQQQSKQQQIQVQSNTKKNTQLNASQTIASKATVIKPEKLKAPAPNVSSTAHKIKSAKNVTIDNFVYVTLPLNQWTEFYFSEVGQLPYSRWTFDIPANQKCSLQVVDAYCTGDRFEALRRLEDGTEISLLSTPVVPFNPVIAEEIRLGGNVNCTPFTTDPSTAWASSSWSKGQVTLTHTGNYKLILKSLLAPYGSGGAYVRINCEGSAPTPNPSTVCSYGSSSIKYIRQTLPFTQQGAVCKAYGLRPLDVTQANIQDARSVLYNCAGPATRAWIYTYNGDNYQGTVGLTLHATQLSQVGAISATPDHSPLEGVLCQ